MTLLEKKYEKKKTKKIDVFCHFALDEKHEKWNMICVSHSKGYIEKLLVKLNF